LPKQRYKMKIVGRPGAKKDNHGLLLLAHPTIEKLSNQIHYVKNYKSKLYVCINAMKLKSLTCRANAMQLSRNLAYMLAQYKQGRENCKFKEIPASCEGKLPAEQPSILQLLVPSSAKQKIGPKKKKIKTKTSLETRRRMRRSIDNNLTSRRHIPKWTECGGSSMNSPQPTRQNRFTPSSPMFFFPRDPTTTEPSVGEQERFWQ
jgi:hypothetical protein